MVRKQRPKVVLKKQKKEPDPSSSDESNDGIPTRENAPGPNVNPPENRNRRPSRIPVLQNGRFRSALQTMGLGTWRGTATNVGSIAPAPQHLLPTPPPELVSPTPSPLVPRQGSSRERNSPDLSPIHPVTSRERDSWPTHSTLLQHPSSSSSTSSSSIRGNSNISTISTSSSGSTSSKTKSSNSETLPPQPEMVTRARGRKQNPQSIKAKKITPAKNPQNELSLTELLIPKASFSRLVRQVTDEITGMEPAFRWKAEAMEALQVGTEDFLSEMFQTSQLIARHAKRVTLKEEDLRLTLTLREKLRQFTY